MTMTMVARNTAARAGLLASFTLIFLAILCYINIQRNLYDYNRHNNIIKSRRLSTENVDPHPTPPQTTTTTEGYTYLIIHYHKSGHILTQNHRDILLQTDPTLQRNYIDRFPKRQHDPITKCPHLTLHPNTVYVQSSPDFFCDVDILAEELLLRPRKERGIKIVHLVRNPYTMAISNYKYHAQDPLPEGENWVKRTNPCAVEDRSAAIYADLFMKTLVTPGVYRLMEYDDFQIIQSICHRLYDQLSSPGFYTHLLTFPPKDGLILATTYLMLGHGGDILRMANNIIKLRQLQMLETQIHLRRHDSSSLDKSRNDPNNRRKVQVLTLSMDNFIHMPKATTLEFLKFVSSGNDEIVLAEQEKEEIAMRYEQMYYEKVSAGDGHITSLLSRKKSDDGGEEGDEVVMSDEVTELEQSLRQSVLWGRILGNIENLVNEALRGVHNWY